MKKALSRIACLFLMLLGASQSLAQSQSVHSEGDYEIHYSIFNSSFISPDVAKAYGIVRSKSQALINVSVLKKQPQGLPKPVRAAVKGEHYDLIRHTALPFEEIVEKNAIYYLAALDIAHKTTIYFTLNVQPNPNEPAIKVQFQKVLYIDGKD